MKGGSVLIEGSEHKRATSAKMKQQRPMITPRLRDINTSCAITLFDKIDELAELTRASEGNGRPRNLWGTSQRAPSHAM